MCHFKDFVSGLEDERYNLVAKMSGKQIEPSEWGSIVANQAKAGLKVQLGIKYESNPLFTLLLMSLQKNGNCGERTLQAVKKVKP